jgi:hypothetical protein
MGDWFFIPWTIQYLIGGILAAIITLTVFLKNPKSWAYRSFLGFGLCVVIFCITAFLHRNAPNKELSALFFKVDISFTSLIYPFLFLMILFLWKEKSIFIVSLLPPVILVFYWLIFSPFYIVWSDFGWNYVFIPLFSALFIINIFGYIILCLLILFYLIKKIPLKIFKRKYMIIMVGTVVFTLGSFITNGIGQVIPNFPPFGGIWTFTEFTFISIAISLKQKGIDHKP